MDHDSTLTLQSTHHFHFWKNIGDVFADTLAVDWWKTYYPVHIFTALQRQRSPTTVVFLDFNQMLPTRPRNRLRKVPARQCFSRSLYECSTCLSNQIRIRLLLLVSCFHLPLLLDVMPVPTREAGIRRSVQSDDNWGVFTLRSSLVWNNPHQYWALLFSGLLAA